jgi:hypothetical protein
MRPIFATFKEKRHFIQIVDLGIDENRHAIPRNIPDLSARPAIYNIPVAVTNLRRRLEKKHARIGDLAKASPAGDFKIVVLVMCLV